MYEKGFDKYLLDGLTFVTTTFERNEKKTRGRFFEIKFLY